MDKDTQAYAELLRQFVAFRSVSTDVSYKSEVRLCAQWLKELLGAAGFKAQTIDGYGNPVVLAQYDAGQKETCLIYGHYDVQPASESDGWQSGPFELTQRDDKFFARGATDNKGLILMHIVRVIELVKAGKLAYNVTFLIEGDEESGGSDMQRFINDHRSLLDCDFVLVSDGEGIDTQPAFDVSFRGVFNAEITIHTAQNDVHSGLYGGVMYNAAELAGVFVARLQALADTETDKHPLYADFRPAPEEIRNMLPAFDIAEFRGSVGGVLKVHESDVAECVGFEPSIEVTGISSGYAGTGFRNSIPAKATIKLNVRIGPEQDSAVCASMLSDWMDDTLSEIVPDGATWDVSIPAKEDGVILWNEDNTYLQKADRIVRHVTGKPAALRPCGGSIPIMTYFDRLLQVPLISLSLANSDCNIHGVDENLALVCVQQGLAISREFFGKE